MSSDKTEVLSFIILIYLLSSRVEGECVTYPYSWCPQNCTCLANNKSVSISIDCSGQHLRSVPLELPSVMKHLNLSSNKISGIKNDDFVNCTSLLTLDLSSNEIHFLSVPFASIKNDYQSNIQSNDTHNPSQNASEDNITQMDMPRINKTNLFFVSDNGPFSGLQSLQVLTLSHNHLNILDRDVFKSLFWLTSLDLSFNQIHHFRDGTFRNLRSLKLLNLQNNRLFPSSFTFSDNAFDGLTNLQDLNIQNNFPTNPPERGCYPDGAFSKLINLENLFIDGYFSKPSCILGSGFQNLTRLSLLNFEIPDDSCKLTNLTRLFFSNITTSQKLKLSLKNCHLKAIDSDAFSYLPTLDHLDLSYNLEFEFQGFKTASVSLHKTRIKYLDISHIHCTSFISVHAHFMKYLHNTSLETLLMTDDFITYLDPKLTRILPISLKVWGISWNRLNHVSFLRTLFFLRNLEILNLSNQNVYTLGSANYAPAETTCFIQQQGDRGYQKPLLERARKCHRMPLSTQQKEEFDTLVISSQQWIKLILESCPYPDHGLSVIKNTSFSVWDPSKVKIKPFSQSKQLDANSYWANESSYNYKLPKEFLIPKNLRQVYGSCLKLGFSLPKMSFFNNHVLELIDASNNLLRCFIGPMSGLPAIKILDLSWNYCLFVSTYFFQNLQSIERIFLTIPWPVVST